MDTLSTSRMWGVGVGGKEGKHEKGKPEKKIPAGFITSRMVQRGKWVHISSAATQSWQSFLLSHAPRVVNIKLVKEYVFHNSHTRIRQFPRSAHKSAGSSDSILSPYQLGLLRIKKAESSLSREVPFCYSQIRFSIFLSLGTVSLMISTSSLSLSKCMFPTW